MVLQETRGKLLINTFVGSISDQPRKMRRRCRTRQVGRERCAGQGADCRTLEKDAIVRKIRSCGKSHAAVALQCPLTAPRHIRVPLISSAGEGVDFLGTHVPLILLQHLHFLCRIRIARKERPAAPVPVPPPPPSPPSPTLTSIALCIVGNSSL